MRRWFVLAALLLGAAGFARSGAPAQEPNSIWWSLRPILKPAPPRADTRFPAWPANPIDQFILHKLLAKGLEPTPPAERRVLLRRLTFDLIGLPPTPEDIDAFVHDKSADAYEKVVDRLLASPRYGERWARHWMDVVHFAETHGHDQDVPRENAWPYRDYLIESFNRDKPYARFIEEQVAGDVLFPEDPAAIAALGFLAAGPWDESSLRDIRADTLDRKAAEYLDRDDMIGTVSFALLSTTVQCARCHDHKFDPIAQEEYYGLQAVFAGVDRANRSFDADPQAHARRLRLGKQKTSLLSSPSTIDLTDPATTAAIAAFEKGRGTVKELWSVLSPDIFTSAGGATTTRLADHSIRFGGKRPDRDIYTIETTTELLAVSAIRLEVLSDEELPHKGPGRQDNGNLHLSEFKVETSVSGKRQPIPIARAFADFNQAGWEIGKAIDGKLPTAWGIYPEVGKPHAAVFVFKEPLKATPGQRLIFTLEQQHGGGHLIGRPRLSATSDSPTSIIPPLPANIQQVLAKAAAQRSPTEQVELARHVLLSKVEAELAALPAPLGVSGPPAASKAEGAPVKGCRPIHMLRRGDIKKPGTAAVPGALACVPGLEATFKLATPLDEGERRAALARWLSSPKNPLTWRAIANRVWHYHFGLGIVATPSDFGRMGAAPTHPELLDWLAATLLEDGGSLKKLQRRIVTSAAYRQASTHNPEFAKVDADDTYLWRMQRSRLDAETLRDAVLQISGKLDLTMGGPSVKHFVQSPGIHRTPKVDYLAFDPDSPGAHRRSIYRFLFRTVPDPFMDALDCPDASQFTAVRSSSLSALQALALLNDPFMVRMSEHFAKRVAAMGPVESQVRQAYRLALGRDPSPTESGALAGYARRHGMANACRLLLNCNEFMFVP